MPWRATIKGLTAVQEHWTYATQRLGETAGRIIGKRLDEAVAYARSTYLTGGTTRTRLAERSGRLKQSFTAKVQVAGTRVSARIGYLNDPPPWVGIHEYGGTIRAKNTTYLAIPLNAEARSMPPQHMPGTFVAQSRRGSLLIFRKLSGGGIEPMYVLKDSVTIPARPALARTVAKFVPLIKEDLRQGIRTLITR